MWVALKKVKIWLQVWEMMDVWRFGNTEHEHKLLNILENIQ